AEGLRGCRHEANPHSYGLIAPQPLGLCASPCYLNVSAAFAGSVPHHHMRGSVFWRGHTSFSVSPSYSRPFFITYRIVFVLWMSSSGLASSTIRSASLPGSSDPRSC